MVGAVTGSFYEAGSSRKVDAELRLLGMEELEVSYLGQAVVYPRADYAVEPALGSLDRVVHFDSLEGDCRFETSDVEGFAKLESYLSSGKLWTRIAWMEGHWRGAIGSVALMACICFAFFQWGLPALAWKVANDMPQSWRVSMTNESLETMEKWSYLAPTTLEASELRRVQSIFERSLLLADVVNSEYAYELKVFSGERIGANAFAFPSGVVVATDEFVELCESDEQIMAVFLHEIAHVELQHGIRSLVQKGGVFLVFSLLLGDVSSAISLAEGIPALVMNSQYSQRYELESDSYSGALLEEAGIGAEAMEEALILLHRDTPEDSVASFLSTHPSLRERIENLDKIREDQ